RENGFSNPTACRRHRRSGIAGGRHEGADAPASFADAAATRARVAENGLNVASRGRSIYQRAIEGPRERKPRIDAWKFIPRWRRGKVFQCAAYRERTR